MTDTTPAPEQVAAMCRTMRERPYRLASETEEAASLRRIKERADAAAMIEALAAYLAAQTARADAAETEREIYHEAAKRHRDEVQRLLLDVIPAAEAKVARLVEVLTWTDMELAKLSGLWHDVSPRKQIRAAITEVQTNSTTTPTEYERKVAQMKEDFPNGI